MLHDETERMAGTIMTLVSALDRHIPHNVKYHPDNCPLRTGHYTLSGAIAGFHAEGWDCPYCGKMFIPRCAACAGDDW